MPIPRTTRICEREPRGPREQISNFTQVFLAACKKSRLANFKSGSALVPNMIRPQLKDMHMSGFDAASTVKGGKKLQPPLNASPGELRLWKKLNGVLTEEEKKSSAWTTIRFQWDSFLETAALTKVLDRRLERASSILSESVFCLQGCITV